MDAYKIFAYVSLFAMTSYVGYATDPNQLQDFCVPENGGCKSIWNFSIDDFLFHGLNIPGNTSNDQGSNLTLVSARNLPGLNTLGISLARLDVAPFGQGDFHTHPRATEILTVLEGQLYVAFITSDYNGNGGQLMFTTYVNTGDVFVFPQGLVHFVANDGKLPAVAISGFSSQNPGIITIGPSSLFAERPPVRDDVLGKAFNMDENLVKNLQSGFSKGH